MAASSADATGLALAAQYVTPPLQANFARQRLARYFAHARNFAAEGIERVQRSTVFRRCKQGREIAVSIIGAHKLGTIGECILQGGTWKYYSTAISPAPTRRRSMSITLYVRH